MSNQSRRAFAPAGLAVWPPPAPHTPPRRRRGYVDDFAAFQRDLDAACAYLTPEFGAQPWLLTAHSMGGCIAARALMRQAAGEIAPQFDAAAFSAPMLKLHGGALMLATARLMSEIVTGLGFGRWYTPGPGPMTLGEQGYLNNVLTTDRGRFERFVEIAAAHDALVIGGASWGWLRAAFREMAQLTPTETPVFMSIGLEDTVVSVEAARAYAAAHPRSRFEPLAGARHEPLMEADAIQARFWAGLDGFLQDVGV